MIMLINMELEKKIMQDIKSAMIAKNSLKLEVLRAIKSAILLVKTDKDFGDINESKEIEILQKLLKQRNESKKIYLEQDRSDLAEHEQNQAEIIKSYLPTPYEIEELEEMVNSLILKLGFSSKKDMGKLISAAMKKACGRADGATISSIIKRKLS